MFKFGSILLIIIFLSDFGICFKHKESYTAVVVDYVHLYSDYAKELLSINVEEYLQIMRNASREYPDIIVFPEYGLVDIPIMYEETSEHGKGLEEYSIFVPEPELEVAPCDDEKMENYSMPLVKISCEARYQNMYTVINVLEKELNNETNKLEYHNTNVVFDKSGTVIARYRKINLSGEPFLRRGAELVTFETDFGVTFGIFTCFDLLFQYPALDILSLPNVTDIIFTTAWYSETPFLQALSIQHGYAKANGVNLLAAGLQEPRNHDGGSAIFLANGTIAECYITNNNQTKIIIQEVPIIRTRSPASTCLNTTPNITKTPTEKKSEELARFNDIDRFPISRENISEYIFEHLNDAMKTYKKICTEKKEFCCTFNITLDWNSPINPDYSYKMAIFEGQSNYGSNYLGGIRTCALLVCLNETDIDTCGLRTNTSLTSVIFKSIHIVTFIDKTNDTYYQPSTLRSDLTPVSEYIYCEDDISNGTITRITMATTVPQESLITFGIYGRMYSNDVVITPPPPPERVPLNYTLILMIISFSVIIIICTAGLLYKFCMKED